MKVALCFWGITRSLQYTLPSIQEHIFKALEKENISYEIFMHVFKLSHINRSRNTSEKQIKLNFEDYKLLEPDHFIFDEQEKIEQEINLEKYQTQPDPWDNNYQSLKNFVLSMFSKKKVARLVEMQNKNFDCIVFLRPDVKYLNDLPVDILKSIKEGECAMPRFGITMSEGLGVNDRFAICKPNTAKIIGSRFDSLLEYSKKKPCHSESFLANVIKLNSIKTVFFNNFLFQRIRANGVAFEYDKIYEQLAKPLPRLKYAIVTTAINLNNCEYRNKLFKNHINNISEYAKKVGASVEIISEPKLNFSCPRYKNMNLEKNQVYDLFDKYDKILRIDSDIFFDDSCPNLFEYPEQYIYATREDYNTENRDVAIRKKQIKITQEKLGNIDWNEGYINSGFILCSKMHRDIYKISEEEKNIINKDGVGFFVEQNVVNWKIKKLKFEIKDLGPNFNCMRHAPLYYPPKNAKVIHAAGMETIDQYYISCAFDKNKEYTLFPNEHLQQFFGHFPHTMEYFFKAISLSILSGGKLQVVAPHKHTDLGKYNEAFLKSLESLKGVQWNHEKYFNDDQILRIKTSPEWCPHLQKFDHTQNWFQDKKIASILRNHILGAPKLIRKTPRVGFINRTDSRAIKCTQFIHFVSRYFQVDCQETVFDDLSFFDQIKFFNDHDIIISPHGAQLTSIPYMPDFSYVIEINTQEYFRPSYYGSLAQSSGKNYISYCHNLKLSEINPWKENIKTFKNPKCFNLETYELLNQKEMYQARSKNAIVNYDSLAGLIKFVIDERSKAIEENDEICLARQFFNEDGSFQHIHSL